MRRRAVTICLLCVAWLMLGVPGPSGAQDPSPCAATVDGRSITYVGARTDVADFSSAALGRSGSWFPQVDAPAPVAERPTGERARDSLPTWVAPLSHFPQDPDFGARTFSQDGPARSAGGRAGWDTFTLPGGEVVASGAIVDPATAGNTNNTVNRIQLRGEVPSTFYLSIVTDNTGGEHDPTGLLRARGNVGPDDRDETQVESDVDAATVFDGSTDVHTFRYDGFAAGDYLKVRLRGEPPPAAGASIGGFLLDESISFDTTPPAPDCSVSPAPDPAAPTAPDPVSPPGAGPAEPVAAAATFTG